MIGEWIGDREETPKDRFAKQVSFARQLLWRGGDVRCCERFTCAGASEEVCALGSRMLGIARRREGWVGGCDEGSVSGGRSNTQHAPPIFPHSFCRGKGP
jgi:hypothetical protein